MVLLVTSASGANGSGYGKLLAFDGDGKLLGPFSKDVRIVDPRGLGLHGTLLFLNSGSDCILALDGNGRVMRETGVIPELNQAATLDQMAGTMSDRALRGRSWSLRQHSMGRAKLCFRRRWSRSREVSHSATTAPSFSRPASARAAKAITRFWHSVANEGSTTPGGLKIRNSAR